MAPTTEVALPLPVHVRIVDQPDGSWQIEVGDRSTRATEGTIRAAEVQAIVFRVRAELGVLPAVVIPGFDAERAHAEEAAGRALSAVLNATPGIAARLSYMLGLAKANGETPVLVLDSRSAAVRELPWELVALNDGSPPVEAVGEALVMRLGEGRLRPVSTPRTRIRVLRWRARDDDASAAVESSLVSALERLGIEHVAAERLDRLPEPSPGVADVLHVICHGRRVVDEVRLLLDEGERAPATASHLMAGRLSDTELVVLDVCGAGLATRFELDGLAGRLVGSGAPAVVAPARNVSTAAADGFARGLYAALAAGSCLAEAVRAGRVAVAAMAIGHPDSRWCNHVATVGDLETVARPAVVRPRWRPTGWPTPGDDAASYLQLAREAAVGAGFIGLEHLALALLDFEGGGRACSVARFVLADRDRITAHLRTGLTPVDGAPPDLAGTPRLRSYGVNLPDGFDLEALWRLISADAHHGLHLAASGLLLAHQQQRSSHDTLPSRVVFRAGGPDAPIAHCLQVVGGPEDGSIHVPHVGDVLGRWAPEGEAVAIALYRGTALTDLHLSRQHLVWLGPGTASLKKRGRLIRTGQERVVMPGDITLRAGDLLCLTDATRLRALERAPGFHPR